MLQPVKRTALLLLGIFIYGVAFSQSVKTKLSAAFEALEADAQMKAGIASIYVVHAATGEVVYEKNSSIGLATASTMKVITSISAYELLGKGFRYKTEFGYNETLEKTTLKGNIFIRPSGDPTLGSWRWNSTKEDSVMKRVMTAFKRTGIKTFPGITVMDKEWDSEAIPDGWMWQDIGNYYGAGATGLNWRENQYDIIFQSGDKVGGPVHFVKTVPENPMRLLYSKVVAGPKGSGDNAYVYNPFGSSYTIVRGTIPINEKSFTISAAMPDSKEDFIFLLRKYLQGLGGYEVKANAPYSKKNEKIIHTETSPPLDSIIYWFHKKSINLYGEALVKTIAYQKKRMGDTEEGVELIIDFWKEKGLDVRELVMVDGSGLSPLNRVTTHAQVFTLQHAQKQSWYSGFYHSLPEYNGMKLKSGTIRGVKGFCGYHTSADGVEYVVSILVNNYNGAAGSIVQKMYKVLDVLK